MTSSFPACWVILCLYAAEALAGAEQTPTLSAHQTSAVILSEDFNTDRWDPNLWGTWIQDKNLQVTCRDGKLRISGVTGDPVPVCADHHDFRFTGLVSKQNVVRDVALACEMEVLAPLPSGESRIRYLVHLCGSSPDYFLDAGLAHEPDGRRGWLFVPIADGYPFSHDHHYPFRSLEEAPAEEKHTVVIDHDGSTQEARGYLVKEGDWKFLGTHRVFLATTKVELKVDVPYDGIHVDVTYDNVRVYPRPASSPV